MLGVTHGVPALVEEMHLASEIEGQEAQPSEGH